MHTQFVETAETTEGYPSDQTSRREKDQQTIVRLFKTGQVPDRDHFIRANLACIECLHAKACNAHVPVSAIAALDLRDSDAAAVARLCIPDEQAVRRLINECAKNASVPTAIVALSHEFAVERIGSKFPDLWYELCQRLSEGSFHLIAFAFGGHIHRSHSRRSRCGC